MQILSTDFDARLEQSQTNTQVVVNELTDQIADQPSGFEDHLAQLEQEFNKKLTRQKESLEETTKSVSQVKYAVERRFERVDAKCIALESKFCEIPSRHNLADVRTIGHGAISPSGVQSIEQ
jgi:oligoendopeptidase F